MVNDSEGTRKIIKRIIIIAIIIALGFVFKGKIIGVVDGVKSKFGTPVLEEGPTGGNVKAVEDEPEEVIEQEVSEEIIYVITESSVNIREDPGVDYKQIATAKKGDEFVGTGNEKEASNGRPWYEIYLDEDKTSTGWVSSKVAKPKE